MMASAAITAFWAKASRLFLVLLQENAHADIIITVRDGNPILVRVDRRYLPDKLPTV